MNDDTLRRHAFPAHGFRDLTDDRSELDDLAGRELERVRKMAARWDAWAAASDVDQGEERFDDHLKGHRQNWGGSETPRLPAASDKIEAD